MKPGWKSAFATITLIVGASPLLAANVQTDYNHHVNFSEFHSYSWGRVTMANPFYVLRVKDEVNKDLQARGWRLQPSGGDVTVFAKGEVVHNQQQLQTYYAGLGGGWGGWGRDGFGESTTTTTTQPVGMLVIDIFNSSPKNLLWRGSSQANLSTNSQTNTKDLNKNIEKMFKNFPPRYEP